MKNKEIKKLIVEEVGGIFVSGGEIVLFTKSDDGERFVEWYRQGNREFNGKYVVEVEYYEK